MKHGVFLNAPDESCRQIHIEIELPSGETKYLAEKEYTQQELDKFNQQSSEWVLRIYGEQDFLADSDSGEDARGTYCGYFNMKEQNAIFENEEFIGFYLLPGDLHYSGNGRSSFKINAWGYPGYTPFDSYWLNYMGKPHIFLFSDEQTHNWKNWSLLRREPDTDYKSWLIF